MHSTDSDSLAQKLHSVAIPHGKLMMWYYCGYFWDYNNDATWLQLKWSFWWWALLLPPPPPLRNSKTIDLICDFPAISMPISDAHTHTHTRQSLPTWRPTHRFTEHLLIVGMSTTVISLNEISSTPCLRLDLMLQRNRNWRLGRESAASQPGLHRIERRFLIKCYQLQINVCDKSSSSEPRKNRSMSSCYEDKEPLTINTKANIPTISLCGIFTFWPRQSLKVLFPKILRHKSIRQMPRLKECSFCVRISLTNVSFVWCAIISSGD